MSAEGIYCHGRREGGQSTYHSVINQSINQTNNQSESPGRGKLSAEGARPKKLDAPGMEKSSI